MSTEMFCFTATWYFSGAAELSKEILVSLLI